MNILFLALAMQATAAAGPFDFRGTPLGMAEADFRAQTIQAGRYGPRRIICSRDPGAPEWLSPPREEADVGAYRCDAIETIGGSTVPADTELTPELTVSLRHLFFQGRLYQISVHAPNRALSTIEDSLTQRFGRPTRTDDGAAQNSFGATVPQRRATWVRGSQEITLIAPFVNRNNMIVLYTDRAVSNQIQAAVRTRRRPVM